MAASKTALGVMIAVLAAGGGAVAWYQLFFEPKVPEGRLVNISIIENFRYRPGTWPPQKYARKKGQRLTMRPNQTQTPYEWPADPENQRGHIAVGCAMDHRGRIQAIIEDSYDTLGGDWSSDRCSSYGSFQFIHVDCCFATGL